MQKNARNANSLCITVVSIISWIWLAQKYNRKCFFLWYFCFLCQKSGSITQWHVKMREGSMLPVGWVMGALDFRFLWLFHICSGGLRPEGWYSSSEHPGMHGPLGRAAVRTLGSLLSPHYSVLTEKLISLRCFFAALGQFLFSVNLPNTHITA